MYKRIDLSKYPLLKKLLKRTAVGNRSKKSKLFKAEKIKKFLERVPDSEFIAEKVSAIFDICGGVRKQELTDLKLSNIKKKKIFQLSTLSSIKARTLIIHDSRWICRICREISITETS
ncbi:hypothetical protein HCN44_010938 [Aphidius gifuensis]|uniref:Uncharacterized protein n=1 Tax=Aphidius gifuensis TaxID=684658 RepID=A0A834Y5H3_APHGI|nr:hypothetical protein HCN44_010938 [Aphidius gifuensis]